MIRGSTAEPLNTVDVSFSLTAKNFVMREKGKPHGLDLVSTNILVCTSYLSMFALNLLMKKVDDIKIKLICVEKSYELTVAAIYLFISVVAFLFV